MWTVIHLFPQERKIGGIKKEKKEWRGDKSQLLSNFF